MNQSRLSVIAILVCLTPFLSVQSAEPRPTKGSAYTTEVNVPYRKPVPEAESDYIEERCRLDIYYPREISGFATVVWFHGGGLSGGEKFVPAQLKNQGIAIVAANYRLHPQVQCPVYIEDAAAAVAWTFKHIHEYRGDRDLETLGRYEENAYLTRMMEAVGHQGTELYELQGFNHSQMADPAHGILLRHIKKRK